MSFHDLSHIRNAIKAFMDIPTKETVISISELNMRDVPIRFSFDESLNLRGIIIVDSDEYHIGYVITLNGKKINCQFGEYKCDNAYITSFREPHNQSEFCISLNETSFGHSDSVNIAVFKWHTKPHCMSNFIDMCTNLDSLQREFEFVFDNQKFHLCNDLELRSWIIFTENKVEKSIFFQYVLAIKTAFNFVCCETKGVNIFIISADDSFKNIEYMKIYNFPIISKLEFSIFVKNLYPLQAMLYSNDKDAISVLTNDEFSKLCSLIYNCNNSQIQTAISYILGSVNLGEYRTVFLCLALEALAKSEVPKLIENDDEFNKIKKSIEEKINGLLIDNEVKKTLIGKIQNKRSNRDVLSAPFEKYKIKLTDDEKKMISKIMTIVVLQNNNNFFKKVLDIVP
jgi:hypothetical protein